MGRTSNILTGALAVFIGVIMIMWVTPAQTVPALFASVPSDFYPNFTSGMLIASGLGLFISGIFSTEPAVSNNSAGHVAMRFSVALILLVGAMAVTPIFGFWQTGIGICLITLLLMRENRWHLVALISIAAPLLTWFSFQFLLGRPLP